MKPKEALIRQELKLLKDDFKGSNVVEVSPMVPHIGLNKLDAKKHLLEHIETIERLLTPPTAEEVCEALSEYFDRNVYYESGRFLYRKEELYNQPFIIAYKYKSGLVELTKNVLPHHLITLIGRFYEGVEHERD